MEGRIILLLGIVILISGIGIALYSVIYEMTTAKKIKDTLKNEYFE